MNEIEQLFHADRRFWIGVVSRSHVRLGVQGGFAQLCHGKAVPLKQMKPGDWLIYYSPRTDMTDGEPLQAFSAIGRVQDGSVYEHRMTDTFVPFRRDIGYFPCVEVPIRPLLTELSFTRNNPNWGYLFRTGHFEISKDDFLLIADHMLHRMEMTHEIRIS